MTLNSEVGGTSLSDTMRDLNEEKAFGDGRLSVAGEGLLSFPATLAQQAFYFFDRLLPGNPAFNVAVRFHLAGPLDVALLERTFNEIVRRHEILRTRFEEEGDELTQVVLPSVKIKIDVLDISSLPDTERGAETERQGSIEAHRRFDLAKAPLIRASLVRTGPGEHMLQVTAHHAVSDGWSIGVLAEELAAIYGAFSKGQPCPLPELPIQFADFALWQREYLGGPEISAQRDYWKRRLVGLVETNLPTDRPRPVVKRWGGDIVSILLPSELTAQLQRMGQRHGATLFMVFMAAFNVLLSRYTAKTDIAVGLPIVGRTRAEVESLIGVFVNTVICRTDLSGNPNFTALLQTVGETVIEAFANQDVPFEMVVKDLRPVRDLSRNPLFEVNFIHQRDFVKPVSFGGLTLTAVPSRSPGAIFDLNFFMVERNGVWRASCDFNTDIFDRDTAVRMLAHFQQLLVSVAAVPDAPINDLEMLTPEERRRLLTDWNRTERDYPREKTVHGLFEDRALMHPNKVAVRANGKSLTYAELNRAATQLATTLQTMGVRPGVLVGLSIERSVDMVAATMAILKSGGAYVPMDPSFPADRLSFMVDDARMPVIVTQRSLVGRLPHGHAKILLVDEQSPKAETRLALDATSDDLAYVIFTSGSTGRPKGVKVSHRAVVNFLNSMRREPGLVPEDVLLAVTTLSFDIAGLELFLPLTTGATVAVATSQTVSDAQLLAEELDRTGATVMQATPVTWRMLLESGWPGNPRLKALVGGEAVPRDLVNSLVGRCQSLWNMYGPTETTIWSTVARLTSGNGAVSIGRPIDNTRAYVVAPGLQLQPVGVPGELLIGGNGLADGYLNREELTADKFIPNPFVTGSTQRAYRTGDLARWRADGTLEHLGRVDHQVKIRGFRIEPGEIEKHLSLHEAVEQAVVVGREDGHREKRLVAYVVPRGESLPPTAEFREYLRTKLPDYMVPANFVRLDTLPLTPNGKIDRNALPAPDLVSGSTTESGSILPRNSTEARLAAIFANVLGSPISSMDETFFDLGGHSLLAVKLMNRVEREFGVRLSLARLFDAGTVAGLARLVSAESVSPKAKWDSLVPIRTAEDVPRLFLVHGGGGNVLLYRELADQLAPDISVYGFQSQGLDGRGPLLTTVREMADRYVSELLKFQPIGPCHLGGYCMGGIVAYEMARTLRSLRKDVRMVALLDTYNLNAVRLSRSRPSRWNELKQKLVFHFENLRQLNATELVRYIAEKLRMAFELAHQVADHAWRRRPGRERMGSSRLTTSWAAILSVNHEAGWSHEPGPYEGKTVLFKPRKNYDFFPDPRMGWGDCVGDALEVVELPVNPHCMLVRPFSQQLAEEIKKRIRAQA